MRGRVGVSTAKSVDNTAEEESMYYSNLIHGRNFIIRIRVTFQRGRLILVNRDGMMLMTDVDGAIHGWPYVF
jgi:hypothetical protein